MPKKSLSLLSPAILVVLALTGCNAHLSFAEKIQAQASSEPKTVAQVKEPEVTKSVAVNDIEQSQDPISAGTPDAEESKQKSEPDGDLWKRVRKGFSMQTPKHKLITQNLTWYRKHPSYIKRLEQRSRPYLHYILEQIEKRGLPTELALLPAVESAYRPFAYSPGRAAGLWQFVPSTGRHFNLKQNWWYDGRRDVVASTNAALDYLESLSKRFKGDWHLALAAYNSGAGTVSRAIIKNKRKGKPTDYWSLKLPRETCNYVPRLLALAEVIAKPSKHGIELKAFPDKPYFASVDIGSQLDLALASEMAEISTNDLYRLNPGFNRWATAPDGPHILNVPVEKQVAFKERLAALDPSRRIQWKRYKIRSGDSLGTIASKHGTTSDVLKQANKLKKNTIRAGKHLVIPISTKSLDHYALSADLRKKRIQNRKRKGKRVEHLVKSGDTFWDLAKTYKVNHRKLAKWNGMSPRDPLRTGQKLVVWVDKSTIVKPNTDKLASIMGVKPPSTKNSLHYRVREGDSLARIAQRFKVRVTDLKRWNTLDSNFLKAGQSLKLYVDVTTQAL